MARTESTMRPLGTHLPDFALPDVVSGATVRSSDFTSYKILLVMFICRHCPYVKHVEAQLAQLGRDYAGPDAALVAISSNDAATHPADGPDGLKQQAQEVGFTFPYLYDETQEVAKAFGAACTPDFFLFNQQRDLVYRGQLDSSRPNSGIPVTGQDLRQAMDALLRGEAVSSQQAPSIGCNIKWKT